MITTLHTLTLASSHSCPRSRGSHDRNNQATVRSLALSFFFFPFLFTRAIVAPTPLPNAQQQGAATAGGTGGARGWPPREGAGLRDGGQALWPAEAAAARRVADMASCCPRSPGGSRLGQLDGGMASHSARLTLLEDFESEPKQVAAFPLNPNPSSTSHSL